MPEDTSSNFCKIPNTVKSIENIKMEFIKACFLYEPKPFIPFLLSKNVLTGMPNKIRFYCFFKSMLKCAEENSQGQLTHKIENELNNSNQRTYFLNFYDQSHRYSRLSFEVKEMKDKIYIHSLPF
ncbi:hypothetical protein [Salinimicrobium xinjiangense]|uniref:hypothetical protein n=1 Tax=Salinimicrobium xinjiangense TaxID=438596 RepID=UPI00048C3E1D|nr:hypothetical protein [Salinimicrobium xinjiangense]